MKSHQNKQEEITLILDTREKEPWGFSWSPLITNTISRKLDVGDYSIAGYEDRFTIERKRNVAEIAGNITEARFPAFLNRLAAMPHKYIICEFTLENVTEFPYNSGIPRSRIPFIKITPQFILSCLFKIQVDYKIPIIYAGNKTVAEMAAEQIIKRIIK